MCVCVNSHEDPCWPWTAAARRLTICNNNNDRRRVLRKFHYRRNCPLLISLSIRSSVRLSRSVGPPRARDENERLPHNVVALTKSNYIYVPARGARDKVTRTDRPTSRLGCRAVVRSLHTASRTAVSPSHQRLATLVSSDSTRNFYDQQA